MRCAACLLSVMFLVTATYGDDVYEDFKLVPSDPWAQYFGSAVSISGDTAVIGASGDDDNGSQSGSAYVFHFDGSQWTQEAKLLASDGAGDSYFGSAVSISGDTAVIGAAYDDANGSASGSAYVFRFDGSQWNEEAKLVASDASESDLFGSVSISGDTVVVGAKYNDDHGSASGSAYVFRFDGSQWYEEAKLVASDATEGDWFGYCVSIFGDRVVIGARYGDSNASDSGSAYVFHFDGSQWTQEAKLVANDAAVGDAFGISADISGNTAVIGARYNDTTGSAYVFHRDGTQWTQEAKLLASDGAEDDWFGYRVSISGDTAVIGAYGNDSAYAFHFDGSQWTQEAKLLASDSGGVDYFGDAVAISGDTAVIGEYVYVFDLGEPVDSDGDGVPDDVDNCYLYNPDQADCNENGIGDVCDVEDQTSYDCNQNNVPDECESDCDGDGLIDECDNDPDIDGDGIPDNCEEDCNGNNLPDDWEIEIGLATDCNGNLVPDECDLADDPSLDCDGNGLFDACEIEEDPSLDCDENGVLDSCDLVDASQWIEGAKLLASGGEGLDHDNFGFSVSLEGDRAIIGAPVADENGDNSGSAYIFHFDGTQWTQEACLLASDGAAGDRFGWTVSISGDTALIGAYKDDENGSDSGSAYIFHFDGMQWTQEAKLLASDGDADDRFGCFVSISGNTAVIGAVDDEEMGNFAGSAYVFHFEGSQWTQEAKLMASDSQSGDQFGCSVSIEGDLVIIGARDVAQDAGAAYIFRSVSGQWIEEAKLVAGDAYASDRFAHSVSISGDTAVIGAPYNDANGSDSGSAYVFRFDGSQWTQETKLLPNEGAERYFGYSVSISGDTAMMGRKEEGGTDGGAYVFHFDGDQWSDGTYLIANDGAENDYFGHSVAVDGHMAMIGAFGDDDNGNASGSAYVFGLVSDEDCDGNGLLDSCEIEDDPSLDCNGDGVLDACQSFDDCNANGIPDECDIANGTSNDANGNGIPDECEDDCNGNGVPDHWDIKTGTSEDCNSNGIPDECDIADGNSNDANGNGIPDECEEDCNGNGVPDDWDIKTGWSEDCNGNLVPDECDIAGEGLEGAVQWSIAEGGNGHWYQVIVSDGDPTWQESADYAVSIGGHLVTFEVFDEYAWCKDNIVAPPSVIDAWIGLQQEPGSGDPYGWNWITGVPADMTWGWYGNEPNGGGGEDCAYIYCDDPNSSFWFTYRDVSCDTWSGIGHHFIEWDEGSFSFSLDCNSNGIPDECEIADGTSNDINSDGVPDECQCLADIAGGSDPGDGDGEVNVLDLLAIIGFWGSDGPIGDINFDGTVDVIDLLGVIDAWGDCH